MKRLLSYRICALSILIIIVSACTKKSDSNQALFPDDGHMDFIELPLAQPEEMGLKSEVLEEELTDLLGANKTGAACLLVDGHLVWEHYWKDFSPQSRFDIYSAGKAFTASAIGLLIDDGKLKVDDPACNILTEWGKDGRKEITIRNLLTMTSGLNLDYRGFVN